MERNIQKNGAINLALLVVVTLASLGLARYTHSLTAWLTTILLAQGVLIALVSWFQMHLEVRESLEKLELDELSRSAGSSALFSSTATEIFPARKTREQFEKYFVPIFSILLLLAQGTVAWFLWQWLKKPGHPAITQPMVGLATFGMFALVLFLLGKFSVGLSEIRKERLLRPSANALLFGAYLCAATLVAITLQQFGFERADSYVARGLTILLAVLLIESLISLILEIYRPRIRGQTARLLYDSRLVGLISRPESLFTTAAHALDYQFGFKVSETWFYQFMQRSLGWLILVQLLALLLTTCVVFVEVGEEALLERFGKPVAGRSVLGPGAHFKYPWPIDKTYRFNTEQLQTFNIGFVAEEETPSVILWTSAHYKEENNFLVANRESTTAPAQSGDTNATRRAPPVNLLTVSIPVHFQITNLNAWAYKHTRAAEVLERAATREVVRYLASVDMNEIMSTGRTKAAQTLQSRIQKVATDLELGINVVFLGLQDIHPPQSVAGNYEGVVRAIHHTNSMILKARAAQVTTTNTAFSESKQRMQLAEAQKQADIGQAQAEAAQFTNQLAAYKSSPRLYSLWAELQAIQKTTSKSRKYVLITTNVSDVITLDLQEKFNPILDSFVAPPPTENP